MKQLVLSFLMLASAFQAQPALAVPHDVFIPQEMEMEFAEMNQADQLSLITRYAGMGYNLLQANPEGDFYLGGVDPGSRQLVLCLISRTIKENKHITWESR